MKKSELKRTVETLNDFLAVRKDEVRQLNESRAALSGRIKGLLGDLRESREASNEDRNNLLAKQCEALVAEINRGRELLYEYVNGTPVGPLMPDAGTRVVYINRRAGSKTSSVHEGEVILCGENTINVTSDFGSYYALPEHVRIPQ